ncbi:recombinase family protein [Micromonospora sp. NPDC003944]
MSSAGQRDDLASQHTAMETFCLAPGLAVHEWVSEIGGGMDLLRPKLLNVMSRVKAGQGSTLAIGHKDRLARLGSARLGSARLGSAATISATR